MFFQNYINMDGRLTRNPEVQTSKNGKEYCRFSICYNERKKNNVTEEWESIPNFFNCVAFGYIATNLINLKKGDLINVVGKLKASQYEDKNGNKVNSFSIIADNVKKTVIVKGEKKETQETVQTEQTVYPTEKVDYNNLDPFYDSEAVPF